MRQTRVYSEKKWVKTCLAYGLWMLKEGNILETNSSRNKQQSWNVWISTIRFTPKFYRIINDDFLACIKNRRYRSYVNALAGLVLWMFVFIVSVFCLQTTIKSRGSLEWVEIVQNFYLNITEILKSLYLKKTFENHSLPNKSI